ncbi:maleylpyruvate isomerase family mycothiol-dependent enzyme [Streptomyces roseirectus]|uniref:Maleylpyruvate isomerase family mycothiol-dependent enzyme n=1 Tax=Streptomyces roseirectus TaxID=2768066 RepID=A0A7H0IGQ9_9ACTN|nr:maleylpyruvate isomerase family mycothiol-dependent enzyme [Streptomyces roseirectus]QNP71975.1 maleylpyruvate isomerase family mycothiol-dependent enzyme [Streptomyces roseirectus]
MTTTSELPRDPELPGRLLATERDALIPLLRSRPDADFAIPTTGCPGWSVRDVLAHCSAALIRVVETRFERGVFSPESNDRDIADRADWPTARIVDELERGMTEAGPVIAAWDGRLDLIALGEWIHAGDVREVWHEPGAYAGAGLPAALSLLTWHTQQRAHTHLHADLDDTEAPVTLGLPDGAHPPARYLGPAATLVRLYSGRPVDETSYELVGVGERELNLFG